MNFIEAFYPRIQEFHQSLLTGDRDEHCNFAGLELLGAPHFVAIDAFGATRYVHLLPAKWKPDDLKAYLELLSIVVADRFGAGPQSIWCMNLKTGKDVEWKPSSRIRGRCEKAAALYARFIRAMTED